VERRLQYGRDLSVNSVRHCDASILGEEDVRMVSKVYGLIAPAVALVLTVGAMTTVEAGERERNDPAPIVIGHRGASGYLPEHTLAGYYIAIQQGADFIEPDLVMTKDGILVARHENEIGGTTNVAEFPEFADRRTTKTIDGAEITGWFTEDFTLEELKKLRARERIPQLRVDNTRFDNQFEIPTLHEVLALVESANAQRSKAARTEGKRRPKPIGVYPETKHPTYFDGLGLSMEEPLVRALHRFGYEGKRAPVFIQSFEVSNLIDLSRMTRLPLAQLISGSGKPYDFVASGDPRTYADLVTPEGLRFVAKYAAGVGVNKDVVIPRTASGALGTPTAVVNDAHEAGLTVHVWTLRAENTFLPANLRLGTDPATFGDMPAEARAFLDAGVDGYFTDHPNLGVLARDAYLDRTTRE
jgi:glycerophosphoryl diester phosphodiesterase